MRDETSGMSTQHVITFYSVTLAFVVALVIGLLIRHEINSQERIETDRVAACTASDNVVGCLEALRD